MTARWAYLAKAQGPSWLRSRLVGRGLRAILAAPHSSGSDRVSNLEAGKHCSMTCLEMGSTNVSARQTSCEPTSMTSWWVVRSIKATHRQGYRSELFRVKSDRHHFYAGPIISGNSLVYEDLENQGSTIMVVEVIGVVNPDAKWVTRVRIHRLSPRKRPCLILTLLPLA